MNRTRMWSLILFALVVCIGIASQTPMIKQIIQIKTGNTSKTYIGWIMLEGMRGSNQWHITSERVNVIGSPWGRLNPDAMGPGIIFSDYYPPGTRLYKIPGLNPLDAMAVLQPDGTYLLAVHTRQRPSKDFDTCYGWVEPKANHSPGHYKILGHGITNVGHVIGRIGTNFISDAFPYNSLVYELTGVDPRNAIAVGNRGSYHEKAIWVSDPFLN